jgi:hypothetical protein
VAGAGFIPAERDVNLDGSQSNVIKVALEPTPETRQSYRNNASFHRTWGWIGIIGGAAIAGGSTAFAVISGSKKSDAQTELDAANDKFNQEVVPCDKGSGYQAEMDDGALCIAIRRDAQNKVDAARTRQTIGYIGIGVGGAVAITGVVLLLTGNDPDKYDRPPAGSLAGKRKPTFALIPGPGEIGSGLRVTF